MPRRSVLPLGASLVPLLLLAACGDLPQPFAGNPGGDAMRLAAAAPPARLDVPPPAGAMLGDAQAQIWAQAVTDALLKKEVPAVAQPARRGDWVLSMTTALQGGEVVPTYRILAPSGRPAETKAGSPVPAEAWASGDPEIVKSHAQLAAADVNAMLTDIQAKQAQADPNSLLNRAAKVYFTGVTGAPGNGNRELAQQMAALLPDEHNRLIQQPQGADYTVSGHVTVSKPVRVGDDPGLVQHIEIVWAVTNAKGHEAGRATQLHDIPAHSLDGFWGDVAAAAAQEAATGVHEVIQNNEGRPKQQPGGGPAAGHAS